jgi:hypothetical protein
MESLASARNKIEFYQLLYLKKSGISDEEIQKYSQNSMKLFGYRPPLKEWKANILKSKIEKIKSRFEVTKYENLMLIPHIYDCWDNLVKSNSSIIEESDFKSSLSGIAIGTAPTGDINAKSILGQDNSVGILLESEILLLSIGLARIMIRFIASENEDGIIIQHPNTLEEPQSHFRNEIVELGNFLINLAVTGKVRRETLQMDVSDSMTRHCNHFDEGILSFMLGHELAHIIKDHHSRIKLKKIVIPKDENEILQTIKKYSLYYTNYDLPATEELLLRYSRHYYEHEADYFSFSYCLNAMHQFTGADGTVAEPAGSYSINAGHLLYLWGNATFLVFVEYLERTIRVLQLGAKGVESPLFSKDADVQNLLFRKTHPSPISRINFVNFYFHRVQKNGPAFSFIETIFEMTWNVLYPHLLKFKDENCEIHKKWKQDTTEMGSILNLI